MTNPFLAVPLALHLIASSNVACPLWMFIRVAAQLR